MIKEQIEADESGKILEIFLAELVGFFENLPADLQEPIWIEMLKLLNACLSLVALSGKHLEKIYKIVTLVGNHKSRSLTKATTILYIELLDGFRNKSGKPGLKLDNKNYNYTCLD